MTGRKIFVGSLPHQVSAAMLRVEFEKYGHVEDVFVKPNCEPGRQWAFVTFSTAEQAQEAKLMCDRTLQLPGSDKACEVMIAKNQGMFGQPLEHDGKTLGMPRMDYLPSLVPTQYSPYVPQQTSGPFNGQATQNQLAPKKVFVGSLPDGISETVLRAEFSKYGQIMDCYLKTGCESGRNWAFLTFGTPEQAQDAKVSCDRALILPGSDRACEVTFARHQGLYGQEPISVPPASQSKQSHTLAPLTPSAMYSQHFDSWVATSAASQGPRKVFVGSLPDHVTEALLRQSFSAYGTIVDVFVKTGCESGRQWAFMTFASAEEALRAKDATDRILVIPGADQPCEVMIAKNQGKFGQESDHMLSGSGMVGGGNSEDSFSMHLRQDPFSDLQFGQDPYVGSQPPPPSAPPPAHLTSWRMYETVAGIPYYHNHASGVTQWECPPELQVPALAYGSFVQPQASQGRRYSPY